LSWPQVSHEEPAERQLPEAGVIGGFSGSTPTYRLGA
jgi:hypothetical protein